jgi:hypothetical protein
MQAQLFSNWDPLAVLALAIVPPIPMGFWIGSLLRIRLGMAGLLSLAINVCVLVSLFWVADQPSWRESQPAGSNLWQQLHSNQGPVITLGMMILANLSIALLAKLYRAAVLGIATPEERAPGIPGVRAWLSPVNILTVVGLSVSGYMATDWGYFNNFLVGMVALLAYPLTNSVMQQSNAASAAPESASSFKAPAEERQRVLALVEAGKITGEDGAELLTALAQSQAASVATSAPLSAPRRIMLAGAATALVGFFFPWFTINVSQAAHEMMNNVQQGMPQFPGGAAPNLSFSGPSGTDGNGSQSSFSPAPGVQMPGVPVPVNTALQWDVRGGDVQHGLGWIVLAAAMVSACLPFFWTPAKGKLQHLRNATLATLGVGSMLLLYILSGSFNAVTSIDAGFALAIVGYVVLWVGGIREFVVPRVMFQPVLTVA